MKIRKLWMIQWLGFVGAVLIKLFLGTLRYRYRPVGPAMHPWQLTAPGRYIYVFWHENILLPCNYCSKRNIRVLISQHADGELIAQVCRHVGFGTIRGSSTRGGIQALRKLVRASGSFHLVVVPDGPKGPRRVMTPGVIYLAAKTGLPIVVVGVGYDSAWRLNTWDQFAIPKPYSSAGLVTMPPIAVPEELDKDQLERYRQKVEQTLEQADQLALRAARSGSEPEKLPEKR